MGNVHYSENSDEGGDEGGGLARDPGSVDPSEQAELSMVDADEDLQEEFGLTDKEMEMVDEVAVDEDVIDENAEEALLNSKKALAAAVSDGRLTEAQLDRMSVSQLDGDEIDTDVALKVNSNNTPYAGVEQVMAIPEDGEMDLEQSKRMVEREVLGANGVVDVNNEAVQNLRREIEQADGDGFERALEQGNVEDLKAEIGNENMSQEEIEELIDTHNELQETIHNDEVKIFGAREDAGRFAAGSVEAHAAMVEELESDGVNAGTNAWQYGADAIHQEIENGNIEPSDDYKRYVDTMNIMAGERDDIAETGWEPGESVFGKVTEDNIKEEAELLSGEMYHNVKHGAGTSNELVEPMRHRAMEMQDFETGANVYDGTDEVVLVGKAGDRADETEAWDGGPTLKEYGDNNNVPTRDDDAAYNVVYKSKLDDEIDGWENMSQEQLAEEIDENISSSDAYTFPGSRLESEFDSENITQMNAEWESKSDVRESARETWESGGSPPVDTDFTPFNQQIGKLESEWDSIEDEGGDANAVVIHDSGDADGAMTRALYNEKFGDDAVYMPADSGGEYRPVEEGLERAIENTDDGTPVYVSDLSPTDPESFVETVQDSDNPVYVRDHHDVVDDPDSGVTRDEVVEAVESTGGEYAVDTSEPAAATMVYDRDVSDEELSNPEQMRENVETAAVADSFDTDSTRWEDARKMRTLQYKEDLDEFTETYTASDGVSETQAARDVAALSEFSDIQTEMAVEESAETFETGDYDGVVAYAGGADRSRVAEQAMTEEDADFAIVATDNDKISVRSREDGPPANEIASEYDGGGREQTAGAGDLGFDTFGTTQDEHHESHGERILNDAKETAQRIFGGSNDDE